MLRRCICSLDLRMRFGGVKFITYNKNKDTCLSYQSQGQMKIQTAYHRFLSDISNLQNVAVDYDHVRKATTNEKVFIIDVREPEEIKEHGKIPNSINIPLGKIHTTLSTMNDKEFEKAYNRPKPTEDSEIIFYCMIGKRSGMAQENAYNLGYKNVKNYVGSWTDWTKKIK